MTGLALGCRLSAASRVQSLPARVKRILNKYGATMLLPGSAVPILGPELVVNGDFSQGTTGWSSGGGATISVASGSLRVTQTTSYGSAFQNIPVSATGTYQISVTKTGGSTQNQDVSIGADIASGASGAYGLANLAAPVNRTVSGLSQGLRIFLQASSIAAGEYKDFDNISVREILGYTNTYASFQSGNYRESTGQTLAAADQQVGLVVDAARSPGPELVTNGTGDDLTGWSVLYSTSPSTESGKFKLTNTVGGYGGISRRIVLEVGKTYRITADYTHVDGSGFVTVSSTANGTGTRLGASLQLSSSQTYTTVFTSTLTNCYIVVSQGYTSATGTIAYFDNISVRELPGIHASQSTSGFQPVLRRGLVNLLTYSNDFGNAAWNKLNVTPASGQLDSDGGYTASKLASGFALNYWAIYNNTASSWLVSEAQYVQSSEWSIKVETFTTTAGCTSIRIYPRRSTAGSAYLYESVTVAPSTTYTAAWMHKTVGSDYYLSPVALFAGTVTAEEIIAAGGIPVTTDAPKSSANGPQYWQFDGTDDRLSLSAVPFQMSDDPFCIVAFECGALGVNRSVIDLATSASSARFANLRINAIGQPQSVVVNDALSATLITAKEVSAGTKLVLAATTAEGVQKLYVDGAYAAEAVLSGTFTPTESYIGSRKGTSENFNGPIHCVIFGKGAISGAELLTLEKFAASLQGRSL